MPHAKGVSAIIAASVFVGFALAGTVSYAEDDGGWGSLSEPSRETVDKLIIQGPRTLNDDDAPDPPPRPKQRPQPKPSASACSSRTKITIKQDGSDYNLESISLFPSPAGRSYGFTVNLENGGEISARIIPKKEYSGRRLGTVEIRGGQLIYTSPKPEDTFEGVIEIRSQEDPSICRALPFRLEEGGCVQAGTQVTMADGTRKPIETVKPGDRLLAHDAEKDRLVESTVEKSIIHDEVTFILHELVPENGAMPLIVTGNHPVKVKGRGWQQIDTIKPGDVIYRHDPLAGTVQETTVAAVIRDRSEQGTVYNLKTSRGNYLANDILIHNKCLAKGTLIDTPYGKRAVESLLPGEQVLGIVEGKRVPVTVTNTYSKDTLLPSLPGKRISDHVVATVNHPILKAGVFQAAGDLPLPGVEVTGTVYDIRTASGNYISGNIIMKTGD